MKFGKGISLIFVYFLWLPMTTLAQFYGKINFKALLPTSSRTTSKYTVSTAQIFPVALMKLLNKVYVQDVIVKNNL